MSCGHGFDEEWARVTFGSMARITEHTPSWRKVSLQS
jgi:hypothetical protein